MSSHEFAEWRAYYKLSPFGQNRDNIHAGIIAASVYNSQVTDKGKVIDPSVFMIEQDARPKKRKQSAAEIIAAIKAAVGNSGG